MKITILLSLLLLCGCVATEPTPEEKQHEALTIQIDEQSAKVASNAAKLQQGMDVKQAAFVLNWELQLDSQSSDGNHTVAVYAAKTYGHSDVYLTFYDEKLVRWNTIAP